jgi:L-ascorbate metabolism protein UlaG (beta-lactamase superfamily)
MVIKIAVIIVCMLACTVIVGCFAFSARGYRGPNSDHFDGKRFFNQSPDPTTQHGFFDFLKWVTNRNPGEWEEWVESECGPKPPERVDGEEFRVTFINHATFLIQMDGINILTDPIWSERTSPVSFTGPKRVRIPGIRFEDLPPIDVVVVSHNHYDHLDLPTLKRLSSEHNPSIYVGLGNKRLLEKSGITQVSELDWWQEVSLSDSLRLTCVPAQHFSSRGLFDRNKKLWAGFVFEGLAGPVYFAGDTGLGPQFRQIADRFGEIRLALLPIGAFLPRWFMSPTHLSPNDALEAHFILGAHTSVAMHFGTFQLGDDGQYEAVDLLSATIAETSMEHTEFLVLDSGEGRDFLPVTDCTQAKSERRNTKSETNSNIK